MEKTILYFLNLAQDPKTMLMYEENRTDKYKGNNGVKNSKSDSISER